MRKRTFTIVALTVAIGAIASGAAFGAGGGGTVRCGNGLYQVRCAPPTITPPIGLSPGCKGVSAVFGLPSLSFNAVAGIKSITISVGHRVLFSDKTLKGARKKTISGVKVSTAGLGSGVHTVTIKIVDTRGVTKTKTLRFVICTPVPRTTG